MLMRAVRLNWTSVGCKTFLKKLLKDTKMPCKAQLQKVQNKCSSLSLTFDLKLSSPFLGRRGHGHPDCEGESAFFCSTAAAQLCASE